MHVCRVGHRHRGFRTDRHAADRRRLCRSGSSSMAINSCSDGVGDRSGAAAHAGLVGHGCASVRCTTARPLGCCAENGAGVVAVMSRADFTNGSRSRRACVESRAGQPAAYRARLGTAAAAVVRRVADACDSLQCATTAGVATTAQSGGGAGRALGRRACALAPCCTLVPGAHSAARADLPLSLSAPHQRHALSPHCAHALMRGTVGAQGGAERCDRVVLGAGALGTPETH